MHDKYAGEGVETVSVSLDSPADKEKVLKFVKAKNAAFTDLILDEDSDVWQKKLDIDGPPAVFVFNREGVQEKQFKDEFTYDDVENLVKELLAKK